MARMEVTAKTTSSGSGASIATSAIVGPDGVGDPYGSYMFRIDGTVDAAEADVVVPYRPGASAPTSIPIQTVGWYITVNGVDISGMDSGASAPILTNEGVTISRSMDRSVQVAAFGTMSVDGETPWGNVVSYGAPLTKKYRVNIKLRFRDLQGVTYDVPLITNGIGSNSQRSYDGRLILDRHNVSDSMFELLQYGVNKSWPIGSNLTRNSAIRQVMTLAGATNLSITGLSGRIQKPVDLSSQQGDVLSWANAQAEVEGGILVRDPRDDMVIRFDDPEVSYASATAKHFIGPSQIVTSINGSPVKGLELGTAPEPVPEVIKAGGSKVVTEEGDVCGISSVELRNESRRDFAPDIMGFQQVAGTGAVSSTGVGAPVAQDRIFSLAITVLHRECDDIVAVEKRLYRWYNPAVWRYQRDKDDDTVSTYSSTYLSADDGTGGNSERGHRWEKERFVLFSRELEAKEYDDDGYLIRSVITTWGYRHVLSHTRSRANQTQAWNTSDADIDYYDLGDGTIVASAGDISHQVDQAFGSAGAARPYWGEVYQLTNRRTIDYTNAEGFLVATETTEEAFDRRKGAKIYLYPDGEYGEATETFQVVSTINESWSKLSGNLINYTKTTNPINGVPTASYETQEGGFGEAERKQSAIDNSSSFASTEEAANALVASRKKSQEIRCDVSVPGIENVRVTFPEMAFSNENAETAEELKRMAERILLRLLSNTVRITTMINPYIEEGDYVWVQPPDGVGVNHLVKIKSHDPSGPKMGPYISVFQGVIYPQVTFSST